MGNFLPSNYKPPVGEGKYYKFEQGSNKFRILSDSIQGWEDWKEEDGQRKPIRTKEKQAPISSDQKPKHFWAFVVWDYSDEKIKIMELTQITIQSAILALYKSEDWGDPKNYDITITKTGEKMETKYNVIATPPKEVKKEIAEKYKNTKINLDKLFDGGDPFEVDTVVPSSKEFEQIPF